MKAKKCDERDKLILEMSLKLKIPGLEASTVPFSADKVDNFFTQISSLLQELKQKLTSMKVNIIF